MHAARLVLLTSLCLPFAVPAAVVLAGPPAASALTPLVAPAPPAAVRADDFARVSPFSAMRWDGEAPEVQVAAPEHAGTWWRVVSIDGVDNDALLDAARAAWPTKWQKRYAEDLVEVMAAAGHAPGRRVALVLAEPGGGARVELPAVEMTEENRRAIWTERQRTDAPDAPDAELPRVERAHSGRVRPQDEALVQRQPSWQLDEAIVVTPATAERNLDELEWLVEHTHSYRDLRGVAWREALDSIRAAVGDGVGLPSFGLQIARFLALFGDGHTRLGGAPDLFVRPGYLPFLVDEAWDGEARRLVAFTEDRSGFVAPDHPYLRSIDGVEIDRWLTAAADLCTRGSEQLVRRGAVRNLRFAEHLRAELGLPTGGPLTVELCGADGRDCVTRELPLAADKPIHGAWPRTTHARLRADGTRIHAPAGERDDARDARGARGARDAGDRPERVFGYLRIAEMDSEPAFVRGIEEALDALADTDGLVVDVRGNGGGSRELLRRLLPRLLAPGAAPLVVNVAAARLPPGTPRDLPGGYLENRFLYPATSARWRDDERAAIDALAARFEPEWQPPADDFSAWHYMVVGREPDDARPAYARDVVVLLDGNCFSATDVFLGALELLPRVTLVGTASGGGSGRALGYELGRTRFGVRLSSMASFRPDGRTYDGRGIEPDVLVGPDAGFFVGRGDPALERALALLAGR